MSKIEVVSLQGEQTLFDDAQEIRPLGNADVAIVMRAAPDGSYRMDFYCPRLKQQMDADPSYSIPLPVLFMAGCFLAGEEPQTFTEMVQLFHDRMQEDIASDPKPPTRYDA